jgi:hypothetical protein
MFQLTKMNSFRRGLEKSRIQDELLQHEQKLNEAERRFQVLHPYYISLPIASGVTDREWISIPH